MEDFLKQAVSSGLKNGATQMEVFGSRTRALHVTFEKKQVKTIETKVDRGIGIRALISTGGNTSLGSSFSMSIKPSVSSTNYVSMQIKVEISEAKEGSSGADAAAGITTSNRSAKTFVVVKDQQTVALGGLMKNKDEMVEEKIPLLGDIPIIGWLFKNVKKSRNKTNLLIFLTPYVIDDTADMNNIFFKQVERRQKFLDEHGFDEPEEFKDLKEKGKEMQKHQADDEREEKEAAQKALEEAKRDASSDAQLGAKKADQTSDQSKPRDVSADISKPAAAVTVSPAPAGQVAASPAPAQTNPAAAVKPAEQPVPETTPKTEPAPLAAPAQNPQETPGNLAVPQTLDEQLKPEPLAPGKAP